MTIDLSIVLAVQGGSHKLCAVLEDLNEQLGDRQNVEVIVAYDAAEAARVEAAPSYPWVVRLRGSHGALIPHLWRDGIDVARGARVALSIVHCRPAPGWVDALLGADLETYAGVGGGFANSPDSDDMGWAIHMLRYSHHTPPFEPRTTLDVAGDNAVYDRAELSAHASWFREGFWEPEVHAVLGKEGKQLRVDPELLSIHDNGYALRGFASQRFRHGTHFGRDRARAMKPWRRWAQLLAAPLVPVVFGSKILRNSIAHPDFRHHVPKALPYLVVFIGAWSLGEARGTLGVAREGE